MLLPGFRLSLRWANQADYTIADFVADVAGLNATAAAEMVLRDRRELLEQVRSLSRIAAGQMQNRLQAYRRRLEQVQSSRLWARPLAWFFRTPAQRLDDLASALTNSRPGYGWHVKNTCEAFGGIEALSPLKVMARGYSLGLSSAGRRAGQESIGPPGRRGMPQNQIFAGRRPGCRVESLDKSKEQ